MVAAAPMSNVLSREKQDQVVALGRLGWSLRRIEEATHVRRETASNYLKAAGVPARLRGQRTPAKPASEVSTDSPSPPKPAIQVSTDSGPPLEAGAKSACAPYREEVLNAISRGRNAMAIYQDLVDYHGFTRRYASVKRYVRALRGAAAPEAHPVIQTPPGEESQVDYGEGPLVRDPITGKYRRTRLFTMTLGFSRKSVRLLTWKSSAQLWAELHEKAFRRLGGSTKVVVLDNLKEGVIKADFYDPTLNPLYQDVLNHYGVVPMPCRVNHPDRKGKAESSIGHTQRTPLKGMRFESVEAAQAYLDRWDAKWADTRIHGTTKRQVAAMFAEEKPHLLPLPLEPFRYYRFGTRTVHINNMVEVEGAFYAAPPSLIGKTVHVQWEPGRVVRILMPMTHKLLREHAWQVRGGYRIEERDRPKKTPRPVEEKLARARAAGPSVGAFCDTLHRTQGPMGVRRVLGMLYLVKRHGATAVDDACAFAIKNETYSYHFIKRYLEHRAPQLPLSLKQIDPLIRQLSHYRAVVEQMATDKEVPP